MADRQGEAMTGGRGPIDTFRMGVLMSQGMTMRTAQQHGQAYRDRLLAHAEMREVNPAYLATHRFSLEDGPRGYDMFKHKTDGSVRAVFAP
jgi:threonine dehydrogenase-like Zn-dependent dehydrogenase